MKLGVIIITYNISAELFLLQIAAIRKFCKDEFVVEIFDNSSDESQGEQIRYHSDQLGLNYCKTFSSSKNSSDSHSFAANFAYQKLRDSYDLLFFADHDCLPVGFFSAVEILGTKIMAGVGQGAKKKYLWPGCLFINNTGIDKNLVDFRPNNQYGLDTGGNLYLIIEKYGEENCVFFNEAYHQNPYFVGKDYNHFSVINDGLFYHIVNSSNWNGAERNEERINTMINVIKEKTGL